MILTRKLDITILTFLYLTSILIVNPEGNFPLNDDWAYALSVKHWKDYAEFKIFNWGEMTLVAHVIWGILFNFFNDFSFNILRYSTLFMGWIGAVSSYFLFLEVNVDRKLALLGAFAVLFNPLYFSLSFGFMTDVPFTAVSILGTLFLIKFFKTQRTIHLMASLVFLIWALMIKQLILILPFAFMLASFAHKKKFEWINAAPFLLTMLVYLAFNQIMEHYGLLPDHYNNKLSQIIEKINTFHSKTIRNIFGYTITILAYMGLFLLPFQLRSLHIAFSFKWRIVLHLICAVFTSILYFFNKLIPSLDNVWIDFGIGPSTLIDYYGDFKIMPYFSAPILFKVAISYIGIYASFHFIAAAFQIIKSQFSKKTLAFEESFSLTSIILYCMPFLLVGIYDRYLIWLIPFWLIIVIPKNQFSNSIKRYSTMFTIAAVIGLFSIVATHDYLSWNRVRWQMIEELIDHGVSPNSIHGGAEFSAWYHFDERDPNWFVNEHSEEYVLSFMPLESYHSIDSLFYERWMPGKNIIYLNRRP